MLYVGGDFTLAGGVAALNVACWDGTNWAPLGDGLGGGSTDAVHALAWNNGQLYAGGKFVSGGGIIVNNIARWDGVSWHPLGTGCSGAVQALVASANQLFAGGAFQMAGGVAATNVALWNGTDWSEVGGGVSGSVNPRARIRPPPVSALALVGDDLIVGGDFARAGSVAVTNMARWDGVIWHPFGGGIPPTGGFVQPTTIASLGVGDGIIVAGGTFTAAGGDPANNLAFWDGAAWASLDGGVGGAVNALAIHQGRILLGGRFNRTGGEVVENVGIWQPVVRLQIEQVAGALRLRWPALTSDGVIEASDTPSAGVWEELPNLVVVNEGKASISVSSLSSKQFYRWHGPE